MQKLIAKIRDSVIGSNTDIETPFGKRPLIYADYTASGRALSFIENAIRDRVLPYYANTHTETSYTGAQTTAFREQARLAIKRAINAGEADSLIFCGSGATAAINRLIDIMGLRIPRSLSDQYGLERSIPLEDRPVVFIGPYEHHSNELPWRESIAEVVCIPLNPVGQIDIEALKSKLAEYQNRALKIGSFSAASNVTGILSDVKAITQLLKASGALSFWDYAAAAPYVKIDMNGDAPIDAVFISPHKFVGGPGTPGILAVKNSLLSNTVPAVVGGGTVSFVSPTDHRYVSNVERREEGGTPAIVESIRAGMVFSLQQNVGTDFIEEREHTLSHQVIERLSANANIDILGGVEAERLPIFSLRFRHDGDFLHYSFVVAVLNDVFGIQARGGCSCAGPYAHYLLGLSEAESKRIDDRVAAGDMFQRPGWVRVNFTYFMSDAEVDYILSALDLVAKHGAQLLVDYEYQKASGTWQYNSAVIRHRVSQAKLTLDDLMSYGNCDSKPQATDLAKVLSEANIIFSGGESRQAG